MLESKQPIGLTNVSAGRENQIRWLTLIRTTGFGLLTVIVAAALIVGVAAIWLKAPSKDLSDLFWFLLISGGVSVGLAAAWLQWSQQGSGLHVQLVATYLVGVVIALVNVAVTSSLMFLSVHDLSLFVLLMAFSAIVSVFFAFFLSQRLAQAVIVLSQAAMQVAQGKLNTRVMVNGSKELRDLGRAFNSMTQQLESSLTRQRELEKMRTELIASVSHDLRTPLASLRLMTEAVSDGVADEKTTAVFLNRMRNEVEYMSSLIEDLLELSQLDANTLKLRPERGNLRDLISDTIGSLSSQTVLKQQQLEGQVASDLPEFVFDSRKIQRVLNNLVSNAIRYTPAGSQIIINAHPQEAWAEVSVSDNGEGIALEILNRIFEPFYRGENSRGRESGGAGLGLAIAKGLVEAHGGQIWAESQAQHGTTFTFRLPLNAG